MPLGHDFLTFASLTFLPSVFTKSLRELEENGRVSSKEITKETERDGLAIIQRSESRKNEESTALPPVQLVPAATSIEA